VQARDAPTSRMRHRRSIGAGGALSTAGGEGGVAGCTAVVPTEWRRSRSCSSCLRGGDDDDAGRQSGGLGVSGGSCCAASGGPAASCTGTDTVKRQPRPGAVSTVIPPPIAATRLQRQRGSVFASGTLQQPKRCFRRRSTRARTFSKALADVQTCGHNNRAAPTLAQHSRRLAVWFDRAHTHAHTRLGRCRRPCAWALWRRARMPSHTRRRSCLARRQRRRA
jgi:hypothetical protein